MESRKSLAQMEESPKKEKRKGGIRTMPFIIANELCDKLANVGYQANMITYLTQQLNMPLVQASNTLTNFGGTASFTPLIGALLADCSAGQFWTITVGSIFYELGLISITLSAILPSLNPPPCPTQVNCKEASSFQLWVLYLSLLLTCLGTGGIRPCVLTFAANQFDMSSSAVASRKWNFFNFYYFCMGTATLTALTVVVYIQDNVGWGWGLGIPTITMAMSLIAFIVGAPLYRKLKPAGSPLVRLAQVVVAAVKKRKAVMPSDPSLLYENVDLDADIATDGRLLGTFMVTMVHEYTGKENNWLPDRNLNRGRLEYYYLLVSGVQVVNLIYYVACAWYYTFRKRLSELHPHRESTLHPQHQSEDIIRILRHLLQRKQIQRSSLMILIHVVSIVFTVW